MVSLNGWTDGELAAKWIVEDFDQQTRDKANGETRCDDGSVFGVKQTIYLRLPGPVPGQGVA